LYIFIQFNADDEAHPLDVSSGECWETHYTRGQGNPDGDDLLKSNCYWCNCTYYGSDGVTPRASVEVAEYLHRHFACHLHFMLGKREHNFQFLSRNFLPFQQKREPSQSCNRTAALWRRFSNFIELDVGFLATELPEDSLLTIMEAARIDSHVDSVSYSNAQRDCVMGRGPDLGEIFFGNILQNRS
jgi:hypothetical protein